MVKVEIYILTHKNLRENIGLGKIPKRTLLDFAITADGLLKI